MLDALCSALGIVLAVVDSSGICTFLNDVAYRLLGIPSDSAIGKNASELSPYQTAVSVLCTILQQFQLRRTIANIVSWACPSRSSGEQGHHHDGAQTYARGAPG